MNNNNDLNEIIKKAVLAAMDVSGMLPTSEEDEMLPANFSVACPAWPGLAKVIEECSELTQVASKIIEVQGSSEYFDGEDLVEWVQEEIADVLAAVNYLVEKRGLDMDVIYKRAAEKVALYEERAAEQK